MAEKARWMVQALRIDLSAEVAGGQMRWMNLNITSLKPDFPYNTIHVSYKPPNEQKQKEYANGVDKSVVSEYNAILPYVIAGRCQLFGNMSAMCSTRQHHTQTGLLRESLKFVSLMGNEHKLEFHFAIEPILIDGCALVLPTRACLDYQASPACQFHRLAQ